MVNAISRIPAALNRPASSFDYAAAHARCHASLLRAPLRASIARLGSIVLDLRLGSVMRTRIRAVLVLSGCIFGGAPAYAESDSGSYVVIPGRPDVPVIVNPYGFDASYTIVEGDFG